MTRLKVFLICIILMVFMHGMGKCQGFIDGAELFKTWTGNYLYGSQDDSVFMDGDTLYIVGAESAYVYINAGNSGGLLAYKGQVTVKDTMGHASDTASVVFEMAIVTGLKYNQPDDNVTETFYALDSSEVTSGLDAFYFYPFQNSGLEVYALYYVIRIRSRVDGLAKIFFREERTNAY